MLKLIICGNFLCLSLYKSFRFFKVLGFAEPDYSNNADWKRMKLIPGKTSRGRGRAGAPCPFTETTTDALSPLVKAMHDFFGFVLSKVLHGGRKGGAQSAVSKMSSVTGVHGELLLPICLHTRLIFAPIFQLPLRYRITEAGLGGWGQTQCYCPSYSTRRLKRCECKQVCIHWAADSASRFSKCSLMTPLCPS